MDVPALNEDIYYGILRELDGRSDVSAVMLASRTFYSIGVNRLLRMGVYIYNDDELVSFCSFMKRNFLDMNKVSNQLRELTIAFDWNKDEPDSDDSDDDNRETDEDDSDYGDSDEASADEHEATSCDAGNDSDYSDADRTRSDEAYGSEDEAESDEDSLLDYETTEPLRGASLLVPVLRCRTNLQVLTMEYCETLLKYDERLIDAFSAFTTLQELHIVGFGLRTYCIVTNLRSDLLKVDIDCGYLVDGLPISHRDGSGMVDPLHMLRRYQDTLEDVTIHLGDVTGWLLRQEPRSDHYAFPHVQTLSLSRCRVIERRVIANAFPNISALDVFWLEPSSLMFPGGVRFSPDWVRSRNAADGSQWQELDYVYGDVLSLYTLALRCPIGRLDLVCVDHERDTLYRMLTVLTDIRPARLVLQVGYWEIRYTQSVPELTPERLGQYLAGVQELTHFGLDVGLVNYREPFRRKAGITQLLSNLPFVRCFSFRLHAVGPQYEDGFRSDTFVDVLEILRDYEGEELARWAAQIVAAAPWLELLCFYVMDHCTFWRVIREGGGWMYRIDPEEGEQLVANKGMEQHFPSKLMWPWAGEFLKQD